jgi:long-subunit acyl-CoA synthetase (AMP-forming)
MKNKINKKKKLNKNLSVLLSTSGSMGSIKFVKLSKKNLKTNTDSIINYLKINNKDDSSYNKSYLLVTVICFQLLIHILKLVDL